MRYMLTKKYLNVITNQEIIVYPWTAEHIRIKIENDPNCLELFEGSE